METNGNQLNSIIKSYQTTLNHIQSYLLNHIQYHIIFIFFFKEQPKLQLRRQIIATSRANLIWMEIMRSSGMIKRFRCLHLYQIYTRP